MIAAAWQLQEAKNNFSRLIKLAASGAAQIVTVHGKPAAVVVSAAEYQKLTRPAGGTLSSLLLNPGLGGEDFEIVRDKGSGRDLNL